MNNCIRELRIARAWSQSDLAAELGVSRQTVNAIELAKQAPSLELAFRIAGLFGRSIEEIFYPLSLPQPSLRQPSAETFRLLRV